MLYIFSALRLLVPSNSDGRVSFQGYNQKSDSRNRNSFQHLSFAGYSFMKYDKKLVYILLLTGIFTIALLLLYQLAFGYTPANQ